MLEVAGERGNCVNTIGSAIGSTNKKLVGGSMILIGGIIIAADRLVSGNQDSLTFSWIGAGIVAAGGAIFLSGCSRAVILQQTNHPEVQSEQQERRLLV